MTKNVTNFTIVHLSLNNDSKDNDNNIKDFT